MSSSSSSSSELPYFCPRCGDELRFWSVPELRAHLVSRHTYETLLVLSQARARSSRPAGLLPLPSPPGSAEQGSFLGLPLPPACLDLASSSASVQLLRGMFGPADHAPVEASTALALPGTRLSEGVVEFGLAVGIGLEERLALDRKISRTFAEVEERVNRRMGRLRVELRKKEAQLECERLDGERLRREKQEVEERAAHLSRQVSAAVEMMERLKTDLQEKEAELSERQQEMVDVECFLRDTAEKEAEAKSRLQVFMETLLARAERAERLLLLSSHAHPNHCTHAPGGSGSDDIITNKMQETVGNRRSYSVSGSCRLRDRPVSLHPHSAFAGRTRTLSLGSGGWDGDRYAAGGGREERLWFGEGGWGNRHHSTEEEEEEEEEELRLWSSAERRRFIRTHTPGSDAPSSLCSTPSRRHGDRQLEADTLRLRAGLFCVFPYLDVRSLLRVAEVCSDWRFVARHPAVWTRLHLENGRVSAQFLITLSQWCTQTHTVVLHNLRPRSRRAGETREDYHRSTRGSVELGVEAVLRSAGGSLLHLWVSQCSHILTDRTLWLTSCYCRNLQTLTYRSSSDPVGHEVLWALGAGCRSISSLQVAPAHPCQQPTRFGERCLQTIGRCWPHLCCLGVGGASCGTRGLVDVVRCCAQLQVLELERLTDLGLQAATDLCEAGLTALQTLVLVHTPVSGQALMHFHSMCHNLRSIELEVSASDYFDEPHTQEAQHLFGEILSTLKVLQQRPGLDCVLRVKAEGL